MGEFAAWLSLFFRYAPDHTAQDTVDKIDFDRFARVVSGLEPVIRELAGYPRP
ncbi:MAG TPA: hypothetical protein VI643_05280 [Planctomycetota bacterium]|nr:hypothetical protein [Planctomycetota bacterium]